MKTTRSIQPASLGWTTYVLFVDLACKTRQWSGLSHFSN